MGTSPNRLICILGVLNAFACSDSGHCDDSNHADTIEIRFVPEVTQPDNYRLTFTSGSVDGHCDIVVGSSHIEPCSSAHLSVVGQNDDGTVVLSKLYVWFDYAPFSFNIAVEKNGTPLLSKTLSPDFAEAPPDGDGCERRQQAVVELDLIQ